MFKNGVELRKNSWYVKMLNFFYGFNTVEKFNNLCPLFWLVVGTIVLSPILLILKCISKTFKYKYVILIGKWVMFAIEYFLSAWVSIVVTLFLVYIISNTIIYIQNYTMLIFIIYAIMTILTALFIFVAVTYFVKYTDYRDNIKLGRETKKLDKVIYAPLELFRVIGKCFMPIFAMFHGIYKKYCPSIKWN